MNFTSNAEMICGLFIEGNIVCITGEMPECDRLECTRVFSSIGLLYSGSVSKKLSFLIVADGAKTYKIDKAIQLDVPVCSTSEFWDAVELYSKNNCQ